ncbi:DUF1501 domain-containing protein [bacterium]|nr:DUF1501 domain-containing protein [bacterium]
MKTMKRRTFVQGCCAGIAAMTGSRITKMAFAQDEQSDRDVLINIFLRGGMDALSYFIPYADPDYHLARAELAIGDQYALDLDGYFGLHPAAARLMELYEQGHLALIPATGLPIANRSHFQAQDYIERGYVGDEGKQYGGWLARHLETTAKGTPFDGVSFGGSVATSLESFPGAIAMNNLSGFSLSGSSSQRNDLRRALRSMWTPQQEFNVVAHQTLDLIDIIAANSPENYVPVEGVEYPNESIARSLQSIAQLIKLDLGLQAATVDFGGWDTHESQAGGNPSEGYFAQRAQRLSDSLHAFWNDMVNYHGKVTMVVMSEFGRRVKENDNRGTDHGHGGLMMVFSSDLAEKKIWGQWPGLSNEQLFQRVDLDVTTDYRTVLSEILIARMKQYNISSIFPNYSFNQPLGLFGITSPIRGWDMY